METVRKLELAIAFDEKLSDDDKLIFRKDVCCWLYYISNASKLPCDPSCALDGSIGIQLYETFIYLVACHVTITSEFPLSNLEDKVLIGDGNIVMNQPQSNVIQIVIGLRTNNWARLIWDPGGLVGVMVLLKGTVV